MPLDDFWDSVLLHSSSSKGKGKSNNNHKKSGVLSEMAIEFTNLMSEGHPLLQCAFQDKGYNRVDLLWD